MTLAVCSRIRSNASERFLAGSVILGSIMMESSMLDSADVRLCLTVTRLYSIVGLSLVVAFM
jgi:hypothetical protein